MRELQSYLSELVERGGSDLHLIPHRRPCMRVDGRLASFGDTPLSTEEMEGVIRGIGAKREGPALPSSVPGSLPRDCTLHLEPLGRFRVHVYRQGGVSALAIRFIPPQIPSLQSLGLPPVFGDLTKKSQGLIIVAGPPGSGKTTTVAAFIQKVNSERSAHIVTFESSIEFLHSDRKSLVSQCEIGVDVVDLFQGVSTVSRKDADVIVVEEPTHQQTLEAIVMLAEAGRLVVLTLPLPSSQLIIQRMVQQFPPDQQETVRSRLAMILQGIIVQRLIPRAKMPGRVLALEILMPNPAIRGMIREGKIRQIYSIMQTGQAKHGMQTMNQALADLYRRRLISGSNALGHSNLPEELRQMIHRTDARMKG